jgi:hypothetical protein
MHGHGSQQGPKPKMTVDYNELNMLYVRYVYLTRPSIFMRDKPILLQERMLHRGYDGTASVEKISLVMIFMKHGSIVGQSPAGKDVSMEAEEVVIHHQAMTGEDKAD